jgi:hypothetical protein
MSCIKTLTVGAVALGLAGSITAAEAAPLPAQSAVGIAGQNAAVDHVQYRRYGYGGYGRGYGYRRGYGGRAAGALAAGAALGIIGGAVAASAAPRYYGGYGYPAYGYGYPAYGYGYPVRGYYYDGY